jgi:SAM-dependent methyltransferase
LELQGIPDYTSRYFEIEEPHEDILEKRLIEQFLQKKGKWAVDLGCGYGRLTSLISSRYENVILMDYSIKELERARDNAGYGNIFMVACDIRNPPLVKSSIDLILMIRVFHHLKHPEETMQAISDKLRYGGEIVLNFNNTFSLPFLLAAFMNKIFHTRFFNFNMSVFRKEPQEGTTHDCERPIYFSSLRFVSPLLREQRLAIDDMIGIGFMHNSFVEKNVEIFHLKRLMSLELKFGRLPLVKSLSPDIFLRCRNGRSDLNQCVINNIFDILCCPRCNGKLLQEENRVKCFQCGSYYHSSNNILDLRLTIENREITS